MTASPASAQDAPKPGKLSPQEIAKLQPGLTLRFFKNAESKEIIDARRVRLAALHVPAGSPPSPWLQPGPFAASLSGYLKVPLRGDFTLHALGSGNIKVHVNSKEILQVADGSGEAMLEMVKGYNRLEIFYTSPTKGPATLRLSWSGEGFAREPIPPDALFAPADAADRVQGEKLREGRVLYATLSCVACHALPGKLKRAECVMPELDHEAPSLTGVGHRLQESWLAQWIFDPASLRPQATMPTMLHGADAKQQALDLAAHLASLKEGKPPAATRESDPKQGEKLFDRIGCVACHHLQEPAKEDAFGRLSLFYLPVKFQPAALERFLLQPHEHYPWIRMPDFKLDAKEAGELAAYLMTCNDPRPKLPADGVRGQGDKTHGAKLFQEVGCANCHIDKSAPAVAKLIDIAALDNGCLAESAAKAPRFRLPAAKIEALRSFLGTDGKSLTRETPAEFSLRQVQSLQCQSCHRRDGATSRWQNILADEGVHPEFLPNLTWAGQKLKPAWTVKLLSGQHDHRARPWLKARMPAFQARAELLAIGLSHEHGYAADEDARPPHDANLAAIGAKLLPAAGGLNCVQCHAVGKQPAVAPFEAPGINLLDAALRLRYDYYPRWMMDPPRVDITTRMPKFAADGQTTALREVLDGDARRQFDAIWHYLQTLPGK